MSATPDFRLLDAGTVIILTPCSAAARRWSSFNLPRHALHWAGAVVVEPRHLDSLTNAICEARLTVCGQEMAR